MSRDNILHRIRTALGRSAGQAVADFPPAGAAQGLCFAYAVWREVIVQQKGSPFFAAHKIHPLFVRGSPQRQGSQGLCFAPVEERRPMGAGQDAYFRADRTDLRRGSAVNPFLFLEDHGPDYAPLQIF